MKCFDKVHKDFDKVYKYYDNFMKLFNLYKVEEIRDVLELSGNEVVVDIGGGTGKLAKHLSESCRLVYVLDESEGMLSKVEENSKISTVLRDALNTGFQNDSVDVVIMSDVFHHIEQQRKVINEIYRILKINGKLIILDFEKKKFKTKLLRFFEYILFGKLYFRSSEEIMSLLRDKFIVSKFIDKGYYFIVMGEKKC